MRSNYWSCTKFADWLRGTSKPEYASSKEWSQWKKEAKANHRFRFWLAEEGLDDVQNFLMWPIDKIYNIKYWFNNRFITKTHTLTSNLKRGQWYDFETRMLHGMFDELVNFVEIERAWNHVAWDKKARKKYSTPWYATGWWRFRVWRSAEAGIAYLNWASKLVFDEDYGTKPGDELYGKPTPQAETAIETLVLYYWWKDVRPARVDPHDASGWSDLCDRRRANLSEDDEWWMMEEKTDEEKEETRNSLEICDRLELEYTTEDEEMMIRLIKIRQGLWT